VDIFGSNGNRAIDSWGGKIIFPPDIEILKADDNRYLNFARIIAERINIKVS